MAIPNVIAVEQTVTATGPLTGTLDTSTLSGDFTINVRVRGLTGNQTMRVDIEDTANSTAFSDATQVWTADFKGAPSPEGITHSIRAYKLPSIRFGGVNNKLRANVQEISNGVSALVEVWLDQ